MLIVRMVLTAVVLGIAAWWIRRTLPKAPRAAASVFRWGTIAVASGLAGYLLLFVWYGVLRQSFGALALALAASVAASGTGVVLLGAARQARRARGEPARPLF